VISQLNGTLVDLRLDGVTILVGGVGFSVALTPRHTLKLKSGQEVSIQTKLVVREDDLSLYGFESAIDAEYFDLLCSVSGIGPKLAMTILGGLDAQAITNAVNSQDEARFRAIPGVGPKTAKLLLISLGGKVGLSANPAINNTVLQALTQLGTDPGRAAKVLENLPQDLTDAELLKLALSELGKGKLNG
jgi:holliday junction DNA helicase RuvA